MKICRKGLHEYHSSKSKCPFCEKDRMAEYYLKNKEKILFSCRIYKKNNLDKSRINQRRYKENNPEKVKATKAKWAKNNPLAYRIYKHNRRSSIHGGTLSYGLFDRLFKLQHGKCACCKADLKKVKPHLDHIKPIAKEGKNIDSNIQLLCAFCNLSKHAKDPIDFMQSRGYLI